MTEARLVKLLPKTGRRKANARDRILQAALEVAEESGAGHVSLDAVAKRAGLSKGGLLYHFPSKGELMQALVGRHVDIAERAITSAEASTNQRNAVATALVQTHRDEFDCRAPASGILVAFAENPNLLEPVRVHQRRVVERIRASASHPELSMIAFLALEGLKMLDVFETNALTGGERERVLDTLLRRLADA